MGTEGGMGWGGFWKGWAGEDTANCCRTDHTLFARVAARPGEGEAQMGGSERMAWRRASPRAWIQGVEGAEARS